MPSPFWPRDYGEPVTATREPAIIGGGFNPTSLITGAGGFWRADIGVTGTSTVTAWADQSSFANNLSLLSGQGSPSWSSTGFNSAKPGVTVVDGGNEGLGVVFGFGPSTTFTVFYLLQYASGNSLAHGRMTSLLANGDANDFSGAHSFETDQGTPDAMSFTYEFGTHGEVGNGGSRGPTLTGTNLYLLGGSYDGANFNKWTAGAVLGSATAVASATFGTASGDSFTVGENVGLNGTTGSTFAFVGFTQKAMNTTDWTNLKTWTNSNWGTSF